ncbi:MAG TPA: hypothetical protein VEA44_11305 [Caulobacter sp.]|nr:hypothetical protein [Caulobacter sp.]
MMDRVVSWSFALALAGFLLFMSFQKFFGLDPNPVFGLIEARSGIGFFEPGMRYITAVLELAAAALVVWPRTRIRGAQLGLLVAIGAIVFHLTPWLGWQVPRLEPLSQALAQGLTAAQIDALNLGTDKGAMFLLAIAIAALAAASIFVERSQARAKVSAGATPPPRASFA